MQALTKCYDMTPLFVRRQARTIKKTKLAEGQLGLMYLIWALAALLLVLAARKGRGRFRRYLRGNVNEELSMATLGARTVVGTTFDSTVNERTFVSSIVARWALRSFTAAVSDGPILCGVAHGDYSDAEIQAWIDNTGSWDEGDKLAEEVGRRKIRRVGIFPLNPADAGEGAEVLNDGKPIKIKLGWILNQGKTLKIWAYNTGTSALATSIPVLKAEGHVNLWPQ